MKLLWFIAPNRITTTLAIVGLVTAAAGILFHSATGVPGWLSFAITEIGIVLIVAVIAASTVERTRLQGLLGAIEQETNRSLDRISRKAVEDAICGNLPRQFYEVIRKSVIGSEYLRSGYNMRFEFSWLSNELLLLDWQNSYCVENLLGYTKKVPIKLFESAMYERLMPEKSMIRHLRARPRGELDWKVDCPKSRVPTADGLSYYCEDEIDCGPEGVLVETATQGVRPSQGEEPIIFLHPTEGVKIELIYPHNLNVVLDAQHPDGNSALLQDDSTEKDGTKREVFRYNSPILPHWSIVLAWWPKEAIRK